MKNRKKRIIIIDNDNNVIAAVSAKLKAEGFDIYTATNTPDADRLISSIHPDLIILDYHMPHESGLDFLARFRLQDKNIPVIMLTADTRKEVIIMALRNGVNDFHPKPYDLDFLLISVRREIHKRKMEMQLRQSLAIQQVMHERTTQLEEFSHEIRTAAHHILSFAEIASSIVEAGHCEDIRLPLEQIRKASLSIQELIDATEKASGYGNHDQDI
ncbi:MAG: response regulator [Nitrospirae bacterium]|nr:response regulator [Magnetococcales bacterium]